MPWRSRRRCDCTGRRWPLAVRRSAEQLFPAFQEFGMAEDVLANSEFTEYETGELYVR